MGFCTGCRSWYVVTVFAVLYRWRVKPGTDAAFRDAWRSATESIRMRYGTGGSRLHRTDEGEFMAYAVWPSRDTWVEARKLPSANPEAGAKMRDCIEESFPSVMLDVLDDLLGPAPR
jgi:heme-degrading monooxygenase HmoA